MSLTPGLIQTGNTKVFCKLWNGNIVDLAETGSSGGNVNNELLGNLDADVTPVSELISAQGEEKLDGSTSSSLPIDLSNISYWDFDILKSSSIVYNISNGNHFTNSNTVISGNYIFSYGQTQTITVYNKLTGATVKTIQLVAPSGSTDNSWYGTALAYDEAGDRLYVHLSYVDSSGYSASMLGRIDNAVLGNSGTATRLDSINVYRGSRSRSSITSQHVSYPNDTLKCVLLFSPGSSDSSILSYSLKTLNVRNGIERTGTYSQRNGAPSFIYLTESTIVYNSGIYNFSGTISSPISSSIVSGYGNSVYSTTDTCIAKATYRNEQYWCIFRINGNSLSNGTVEAVTPVADAPSLGAFRVVDGKVYTLLYTNRYAQIVEVKRFGTLTF